MTTQAHPPVSLAGQAAQMAKGDYAMQRAVAALHVFMFAMAVQTAGAQPAPAATGRPLPPATAEQLPRWRGFNLPNRMDAQYPYPGLHNRPFAEKTMRLIAELGFNFVRLPLDYRFWVKNGNWASIDEDAQVLAEIDRMVEWGGKCGIHVCINFHTAPGYSNTRRYDEPSLWESEEAQRVCAMHWAYFARRYRGIPN